MNSIQQIHGLRIVEQMPTIGDLYKLFRGQVQVNAAVFEGHPPIASVWDWTEQESLEYDLHSKELNGPGLVYWDYFLLGKYIEQVKRQQMVLTLYDDASRAIAVRSLTEKSWIFLYYNYDGILIEVYSPLKHITDTIAEHYKTEEIDYPGLLTAPGGAWVEA